MVSWDSKKVPSNGWDALSYCLVLQAFPPGAQPQSWAPPPSSKSSSQTSVTSQKSLASLGLGWSISFIFLYETWKKKIGGRSCSSFNPDLTNMVLSCIDTIEVILSDLTGVAGSVILLFSWRQGQERRCRDVELREWDIRQIMRRELCAESDGAGALRN